MEKKNDLDLRPCSEIANVYVRVLLEAWGRWIGQGVGEGAECRRGPGMSR